MDFRLLSSSRRGGRASGAKCALTAALAACTTACTPTQVRYEMQPPPAPSAAAPDAVLYLVGDAGEVNPERDEVLAHLTRDIRSVAEAAPTTPIVATFLGDNIYDEGLPTEPSESDLEKLSGQILALTGRAQVRGVFLPGNHDWASGASLREGRAAIERQSEWIERVSPGRDIRFLPDDGCPGPAGVSLGETVRLVFIDTEWLLRRPERRCGTASEFYARLTEELRAHADRPTVIMAHHPLVSGGPHGGNVAPFQRGPLVYYLALKSGASVQDIASRRYSSMVRHIREAIAASGTRPLAFVAGHDHTLQVIGPTSPGSPAYQLVSGAGSKTARTRWIPGMRYATDGYGYMRLDFGADDVTLTIFARGVDEGPVRAVFGCELSTDGTNRGCTEAPRVGERP